MALPYLPEDIWGEIFERLSIRRSGRLEMVSVAFKRAIWTVRPVLTIEMPYYPENPDQYLKALARKPEIISRLKQITEWFSTGLKDDFPRVLVQAHSLHTIQVPEPENCCIINLLAESRCPIVEISLRSRNAETYNHTKLGSISAIKSTLRSLLWTVMGSDFTPAPPSLLSALAIECRNTLKSLIICTAEEDWRLLKPMTGLQELSIITPDPSRFLDLQNPASAITLLRGYAPPQLGINVTFLRADETFASFHSITSTSVSSSDDNSSWIRHLIKNEGGNPNLSLLKMELRVRRSLLDLALVGSRFKSILHSTRSLLTNPDVCGFFYPRTVMVLIELGADVINLGYDSRSVFSSLIETARKKGLNLPGWREIWNYVAGEPWEKALKDPKNTPQSLLGYPPSEALLRCTPSDYLEELFELVAQNPRIFGPTSVTGANAQGCNLAHLCPYQKESLRIIELGVDWRHRDHAGRDAIECLARRGRTEVVTRLLLEINDQEFIDHCTPLVWGSVGLVKVKLQDRQCLMPQIIARLLSLVPVERHKPAVMASLHVQLRRLHFELLGIWLNSPPELQNVVHEALFEDHAAILSADWFPQYPIPLKNHLPLPHLFVLFPYLFPRVQQAADRHFRTAAAREAWFHCHDSRGRTPLHILQKYRPHDMRNLMAFVELAKHPS